MSKHIQREKLSPNPYPQLPFAQLLFLCFIFSLVCKFACPPRDIHMNLITNLHSSSVLQPKVMPHLFYFCCSCCHYATQSARLPHSNGLCLQLSMNACLRTCMRLKVCSFLYTTIVQFRGKVFENPYRK